MTGDGIIGIRIKDHPDGDFIFIIESSIADHSDEVLGFQDICDLVRLVIADLLGDHFSGVIETGFRHSSEQFGVKEF